MGKGVVQKIGGETDGEVLQGRSGELLQEPVMFQASRSKGGSSSWWCLQTHNVFAVPSASSPPAGRGAERCPVVAGMARCCRRSPASRGNAKPPAPAVARADHSPGSGCAEALCSSWASQPKVWHDLTVSAAQMPSVSRYTLTAATVTLQNAFIYTKSKAHAREGQP